MINPSTTKTEHRALNALEAIIDEHDTMDYQFFGNDKEMSWDGSIWIFKENNGEESKHNFDGRLSVQIKGHNDINNRYVNKKSISYRVALDDLRAYGTEKGVLYFQIFLGKHKTEVFYASLFPSKIAAYIEKAERKKRKESINIPFVKLAKNADTLYYIVKQFDNESKQQGTMFTPLVQNRIRVDEFEKIRSIHFSVVGVTSPCSVIERFVAGDVCLYGLTTDDKYQRPIDWPDHLKVMIETKVVQSVSIDEHVYYDQYRLITDSDENYILLLSKNLQFNLTKGSFTFTCKTGLGEAGIDAAFLLHLKQTGKYYIKDTEMKAEMLSMPKEFEDRLHLYYEVYSVVKDIGFDLTIPISDYTDQQLVQIDKLMGIKSGKYNERLSEGINKYQWKFGDKYVPLLLVKNGDSIDIVSSIYTDKYAIYLPDGIENKGYRMPLFAYADVEVLGNLCCYDYPAFEKQIENSEFNERSAGALLECALKMISVYDICSDDHFLDLAILILNRLNSYESEIIIELNKLQIKKRKGGLEASDITFLNGLPADDLYLQFGKYVLLGQKEQAMDCFKQFPDDKRNEFANYPIYTLLSAD